MTYNVNVKPHKPDQMPVAYLVANRLRSLRSKRGFSLRLLAELSGMNINTLSMIENGKSCPSVSTLQQLALALDCPIQSFFEEEPSQEPCVFTESTSRPVQAFGKTLVQDLGKSFAASVVQPYLVVLNPGAERNADLVIHTGYELAYCLKGSVTYQVGEQVFALNEGDSLLFEAHLPHRLANECDKPARLLLVFNPSDSLDEPGRRHFLMRIEEMNMKIAVITDDGKTISQHFGRAPYYLVVTIENGKIVHKELREKLGHGQFHAADHVEEGHETAHGMGAVSHNKHVNMAQVIADCTALLCGGMGMGAYQSMRQLNIKPVVTDLRDVDAALQAFINGDLVDHTELLH